MLSSKKIIYLMSLFVLLMIISSCSKFEWEIETDIHPRVLEVNEESNTLSIQYFLGPLEMLDDLKNINHSHLLKIKEEKDNLTLTLKVHYDDALPNHRDYTYFDYYFKNGVMIHSSSGMNYSRFQRHNEDIPGFKWLIKDYNKISQSEELETEPNEPNINKDITKEL